MEYAYIKLSGKIGKLKSTIALLSIFRNLTFFLPVNEFSSLGTEKIFCIADKRKVSLTKW